MTTPGQRIFTGAFALLFLLSAGALSAVVIFQTIQDNNAKKTTDASSQTTTNDTTAVKGAEANNNQSKENKLQGTKLANYTPTDDVKSLQKIDIKEGTGAEVKPGDTVTVDYTGAVAATGVIFQSSLDTGQPISFSLNGVIKGWTDGVPGMKVGGERRLIIPADQAYGANPPAGSGIPANAPLVFDITLHKIGS